MVAPTTTYYVWIENCEHSKRPFDVRSGVDLASRARFLFVSVLHGATMSLNVTYHGLDLTYHGLDVTYSSDLCEVEQPQKRFKAVRRRSANVRRSRTRETTQPHRNSQFLDCTLSLSQVSFQPRC